MSRTRSVQDVGLVNRVLSSAPPITEQFVPMSGLPAPHSMDECAMGLGRIPRVLRGRQNHEGVSPVAHSNERHGDVQFCSCQH
jgi:hypothetical protein